MNIIFNALYLAFMGITGYMMIVYADRIYIVLFLLMFIHLLVFVIYYIYAKLVIKVQVNQTEDLPVFEVINKGKTKIYGIMLKGRVYESFGQHDFALDFNINLKGREKFVANEAKLSENVLFTGNGRYTFEYKVLLTDIFGLLKLKLCKKINRTIIIISDEVDTEGYDKLALIMPEATENRKTVEGDDEDNLEICGAREYNINDRVSLINWKLSQRLDKLMVKEFEKVSMEKEDSNAFELVIFANPYWEKKKDKFNSWLYIDIIKEVMNYMYDSGKYYIFAWYDYTKGKLMWQKICKEADIYEALKELASSTIYNKKIDIQEDILSKANVTYEICLDLRIRKRR